MPTDAPIDDSSLDQQPASAPLRLSIHANQPQQAPLVTDRPALARIKVVDTPEPRVHHPSNILGIIGSAVGIILVLLAAAFAEGTTADLTGGVQGFNTVLHNVLIFPVAALENFVAVVAPLAVLVELSIRKLARQVVESIVAALLGIALGLGTYALISHFASEYFLNALSTGDNLETRFVIPSFVTSLTALLIVAGPRTRRRTVTWSWNLLIAVMILATITAIVPLQGMLIALFLGLIAGKLVQYVSGVRSERAYGEDLLLAVHRSGFAPTAMVRIRDLGAVSEVDASESVDGEGHTSYDSAALALARSNEHLRVYAMMARRIEGGRGPASASNSAPARYDVVVLDGDRQVASFAARWWRALRLRGLEGRAMVSLRAVAERTALMHYAAANAGVRVPRMLGIGMADDSVVLVVEHAKGAVSLRDIPDSQLAGRRGDAVMSEIWKQLGRAHHGGLVHQRITQDVLLVDWTTKRQWPTAWIAGWEQGQIAASVFSRRLDMTQALALMALRVGAQRAVASAVKALPAEDIEAIGPLLQTVALPAEVRAEVRQAKGLMNDIRQALATSLPGMDMTPQPISRFGLRTMITAFLAVTAVSVVVTTINFADIADAITQASAWWVAAALVFSAVTWVGSALNMLAFAPVKIPLHKAVMAQMAGSFVALATPAGVGPAALNTRFLNKRGLNTPAAVATAALMQVSQFTVTIVMLLILFITTGTGATIDMPASVVITIASVVGLIAMALTLSPPARRWVWGKVKPTLSQLWPRLSQMVSQPKRLLVGVGGSLLQLSGYVMAFQASVWALGIPLSFPVVVVIYLAGNTVGALVPTPGGVGAVEAAFAAGLAAAMPDGSTLPLAMTVAVLFRIVTYWVRIPVGWMAMRLLERQGNL